MNPGPFTLRELVLMAEGRGKLEWGQTAELLSMIYNRHRGENESYRPPENFNPYTAKGAGSVKSARVPLGHKFAGAKPEKNW